MSLIGPSTEHFPINTSGSGRARVRVNNARESQRSIGQRFGTSQAQISAIKRGKIYRTPTREVAK